MMRRNALPNALSDSYPTATAISDKVEEDPRLKIHEGPPTHGKVAMR
jgi:hypothetical protein